MRRITSELLRRHDACQAQIELFIKLGGDELSLTEELCLEHAQEFSWDWAANYLMTSKARARYASSYQAAYATYSRRVGRLKWWSPWDNRRSVMVEFNRARASAFFRAWSSPENQGAEPAP